MWIKKSYLCINRLKLTKASSLSIFIKQCVIFKKKKKITTNLNTNNKQGF